MWHLQPHGGAILICPGCCEQKISHSGGWVSSHLIQQNEIIQPVVKIINESHIGYMSVSLGRQVVLVLHTQFMGKLRNYIDSWLEWGRGVGWLLFWFSPGHTAKRFVFRKQSVIARVPTGYEAHRAEIDFSQFLTKIRQSLHVLFLRRDWMERTLCVCVR